MANEKVTPAVKPVSPSVTLKDGGRQTLTNPGETDGRYWGGEPHDDGIVLGKKRK
jgi:hypothetical protein